MSASYAAALGPDAYRAPTHPVAQLTRLRDWPERLDVLLRQRAGWPFVWGVNDCCTFAADAVQAITGVDVMGTLRQRYHSAFEALGLTQELGGLRGAVSSLLGEPCDPVFCTVGDVLLVMNDGRELLAVCNGASAIAPGPRGLETLANPQILAAWRVA
jgi:hypothetical protein